MGIQTTIKEIRNQLPDQVRLVAVSKFHPIQAIEEAYAAGQRIFGESKVQEMDVKHAALPSDIEWHFIGHLQTNKVKYIVPYVSMIHAVDSYKLLAEINKQAAKCGRTIPCLLEIHIAQEDSKFGFTFQECRDMLKAGEWQSLTHVDICGVMGMATNTDNEAQVYHEFETIYHFFEELKSTYFKAASSSFKEVSMGMSHDYPLAIRAGSTLVRIGSKIFGERNY
ncbi:MAG: YggS family pyridoxal phosphate-dependent enzyme [Bacteroides sp.]|nr:YggS family pyridoxal phosphate-dependent enzyme [Bacteroides sp.]